MTTIWLTQKQLDAAVDAMKRIDTHYDQVEVYIPQFEAISLEPSTVPIYKSIHLLFRRQHGGSSEFELATPVQICDEWLAKKMQKC